MSDETFPLVAENATIESAIDLRQLTLLGVMQAHDGPAALLRSSRGRIVRIQTGAQAFGYTIAAIGEDRVQLIGRNGAQQALALAGT